MRRVLIIVLLVITVLSACKNKEDVPEDILDKSLLKKVLIDVHLADASFFTVDPRNTDSSFTPENVYYSIFKNHQITRKQFEESVKYYSRQPEVLAGIYEDVIHELSRMEAEVTQEAQKDTTGKE